MNTMHTFNIPKNIFSEKKLTQKKNVSFKSVCLLLSHRTAQDFLLYNSDNIKSILQC